MGQFGCEDDGSCRVIHNGKSRRFCAWIDLEPQRCGSGLLNVRSKDDGERSAPIHSRLPRLKEDASAPRMHRGKRLLVGI
jgi:hypothetical protein